MHFHPTWPTPFIACALCEQGIFEVLLIFLEARHLFSRLDFPIYSKKEGAFLNFVDDGLTNAILFIDVKKTFDTISMRFFCRNWIYRGLKVQVLIFSRLPL